MIEHETVIANLHVGNIRNRAKDITQDVYVGRKNATFNVEQSVLHNMHNVGNCRTCNATHASPGSTIPFFERDFNKRVSERDSAIMAELRRIYALATKGPVTLVCWCHPNVCHASSIINTIKALVKKQI